MDLLNRLAPLYRMGKTSKGLRAAASYVEDVLDGKEPSYAEKARKYNVSGITVKERSEEILRILGVDKGKAAMCFCWARKRKPYGP